MKLKKIRADDFVYGCRSGIQKAVRRCDLDLAHTCFNTLWEEPKHRSWLLWRSTTLVMEEAWHMIGELAEISASKNEKVWRRFIYRLTLTLKSKDAVGLWFLTDMMTKVPLAHPEFEEMAYFKNIMIGRDPSSVASEVYKRCIEINPSLSAYEKKALAHLRKRTFMGGMHGDRCICLSGMFLVAFRGIDKKTVLPDIKRGKARWFKKISAERKPVKLKLLPWYVFDIHTQAGKIAKSIYIKNHMHKHKGMTEESFRAMWFHLESAYNPKDCLKLRIKPDFDNLTCFDSAWHLPFVRAMLRYRNKTPKEVVTLWRGSVREEIMGCVKWIVEKRADDPESKRKYKKK